MISPLASDSSGSPHGVRRADPERSESGEPESSKRRTPENAGRTGRWRRIDSAADGLALDLGLYLVSAAFAGVTAATSTLMPHRAWGSVAVWGYAAAALATLVLLAMAPVRANKTTVARIRAVITALAAVAVAIVPLVGQAVERAGGRLDRAQEEVVVIELAGQRLLDTGTPYLERAAIAALPDPERLLGYLPYQPGMALFGLPRALSGDAWWTDARVWFAIVTAAALLGSLTLLRGSIASNFAGSVATDDGRRGPLLIRAAQVATVLPLCALTLATGGDDLPVLALCLLALGYAARHRLGVAGLVIGVASALKLFAWPVLLVLGVYAFTRGRIGRYAAGALGLPALTLLPAVLLDPAAVIENVLRFPLGQGLVTSPAQSPFPGHLIAEGLPAGRPIATALILVAGLAIAIGLIRRPPAGAGTTSLWAGGGLLALILLMPSTRFGYLLYPAAFLVWSPALRASEDERVEYAAR